MILGFEVPNLERLSVVPIKVWQGDNLISFHDVYFLFADGRHPWLLLRL
jgi:hypothetical protein